MNPVPVIRDQLLKAVKEWAEKNRDQLDRWHPLVARSVRRLEREPAAATVVAGYALWVWQLLAQLGMVAQTVTPEDGIQIEDYKGFDVETTDKLVLAANTALKLLSIPFDWLKAAGWEK